MSFDFLKENSTNVRQIPRFLGQLLFRSNSFRVVKLLKVLLLPEKKVRNKKCWAKNTLFSNVFFMHGRTQVPEKPIDEKGQKEIFEYHHSPRSPYR